MWQTPADPANEVERVAALDALDILDEPFGGRFDRIARLTAQFYGADTAFVSFVDSTMQWLISRTTDHLSPTCPREQSVCQVVVSTSEPLIIGDLWSDPGMDGHPIAAQVPLRFYAGVPLKVAPELVVGSLCLMKAEPQDPTGFDLEPLQDFAEIAADEIELYRRNRELERLSETDQLTGVANRRGFDSAVEKAVRRARRTGGPLSMLMVDLDYFKRFNDLLGHQKGDQALRHFAHVLATIVNRPYDFVARYGGEEFAVILPETDPAGARHVADKIRGALHSDPFSHPGHPNGLMTCSIGMSTLDAPEEMETDTLMSRADAALYAAKAAGRDQAIAA